MQNIKTMPFEKDLYLQEVKRKLFHCLSLVYALGYFYYGRERILQILLPVLLVVLIVEVSRLYFPPMNKSLIKFFGGIQREHEERHISGIFWSLLGSILTFWFFRDPDIVYCSMGYLAFGDAAAALVGIPFGKHRFRGKSLEGSVACFMVCLLIGLCFLNPLWAIGAAIFVTLIELTPLPWNDNLWIPVLSGCFLSLKNIIL